ncbi:MAG: 4Fe-4S dicluster domain-containing protein [Candidatus Omnitrophota bacterium]
MQFISQDKFFELLTALKSDYEVYLPVKKGEQRFFVKYEAPADDILFGEVRAFEPLKAFFTKSREIVAEDFKDNIPGESSKPFAIVGVKACDLKGFKIQDHVFRDGDLKDPFYIKNREENLIISADCTCAIDTCFCMALGIKPHPTANFDINISEAENGFVVETGSEKGKTLVSKYASFFQDADGSSITNRDKARSEVIKAVEKNIEEHNIPCEEKFVGIIERNYESGIWEDEAKACVECGACTTICPTCHCFFLYDQKNEEKMARLRIWDSCMLKSYARVAGGANPRPQLAMRLRNRFEKKFDFFPKVATVYACTGCGRCVSACPAKIDIRKVLGKLTKNA